MPRISSFAIDYNANDFAALSASTFDLIIIDGCAEAADPTAAGGLSDTRVASLIAQGRTIVGYVDVAVTDATRPYWDPSWTDGGDDLDPVEPTAPDFLQGRPTNSFGVLVDYTDPEWQAIVIAQAVDLVERGYSGVFLDDLGAYFVDGNIPQSQANAVAMIDLLDNVITAIRAVNPHAYIIVNSSPYLGTDADGAEAGSNTRLLALIDAMLVENQGGNTDAFNQALNHVSSGALILDGRNGAAIGGSFSLSDFLYDYAHGIVPYRGGDLNWSTVGAYVGAGTTGNDHIQGGDGPNQLNGLAGADEILGWGGADHIVGGAGADVVNGGAGIDVMNGGADSDTYVVDNVSDSIIEAASGGTADLVRSAVNWTLGANLENLTLIGAAVNGVGNTLANTITGNTAANALRGENGADTLRGAAGNDVLNGGAGHDALTGNAGADKFVFASPIIAANSDTISDFTHGADKVLLENSVFAGLGSVGALAASRFFAGANAHDANDRIIYDSNSGRLYYDDDGNGAHAKVLIATLTTHPTLTADDIQVI